MIGKNPNPQGNLFVPALAEFIDMNHKLVLLAGDIDWQYFQEEFKSKYSANGRPAMPIRFMVAIHLLKHLYNLGDETVAETWVTNPYFQYFCGETLFQHKFPCDPSDMVHFRNRIGKEGFKKIFEQSVKVHKPRERYSNYVLSDTTVQENNTTFPTDARLLKKVIDYCNRIAKAEGLAQRQTYVRVSKQLLRDTCNGSHPKRIKKARKAKFKLRTIAGRVLRELERNFSEEQVIRYREAIKLYWRVVGQKRHDKDKIYSLHKPFTQCIAKGKAHKPYEFGNKIGLIVASHQRQKIILAVKGFVNNIYDGHTIGPLLKQMKEHNLKLPREVIYDRGGRGKSEIEGVKISTPKPALTKDSPYQRRAKRKKFRTRAAIEPINSHLKRDFRMQQNYYHYERGVEINAYLAACGWNLKRRMEVLVEGLQNFLFPILRIRIFVPCFCN